MAKILAFANQKGGVGKTTSAVNIAASLGVLGKKVLLCDLDPQGNSSSGFGINKRGVHTTTYEMLIGSASAEAAVVPTVFENCWVIPSNINLAGAEFDLFEMDRREYRLKEALEPVLSGFDYVIVDCPPSLGMLTVNGLTAADGVVIPMQCEFYALEGLGMLMNTVSKIKTHYNPDLEVTGILLTMYNGRLVLSMQCVSELKKYYADKLFSTTISRNVKLSEAPGFGVPVWYHDKNCKGSQEYLAAARELAERI